MNLLSRFRKPKPYSPEDLNMLFARAERQLGSCGRTLGFNTLMKPESVKNANVCTARGKLWFGDLCLNPETQARLQTLADEIQEEIFVLSESDARWDTEKTPRFERAKMHFTPNSV